MLKFLRTLSFLILATLAAVPALGQLPQGAWTGELAVGQQKIPLVLHFDSFGAMRVCAMDSPAQGAKGIPVTVLHLSADSLSARVDAIGATFRGTISGERISGTFSQGGYDFPLTLQPELPLLTRRPQTPVPPFPYSTIDTTFLAPDGMRLACTVTLPPDAGPATSIAVLVTGSGKQNRDEEVFDHRPFAVIADALARRGVATLRYDDRGAGASQGDFAKASIRDFKADAEAALAFARTFAPRGKAGVIGHSEGGTIAMLMAAEGKPDFIVSLGGMAVSGKETVLEQNRRALAKAGYSPEQSAAALKLIDAGFAALISQAQRGVCEPVDADSIAASIGVEVPAELMAQLRSVMSHPSPTFTGTLATDARASLGSVRCPFLAINGTLDTQVDCEANLGAIRAGVPHARTMAMPGLNHLLQHAATGESDEYATIRETISPDALTAIADFITSLKR